MSKGDDQVWFAENLGKSRLAKVRVDMDQCRVWFVMTEQELKESLLIDNEPMLEISAELLDEVERVHKLYYEMQGKLEALYRSQHGMTPDQYGVEPPAHKVLT